MLDLSVSFRYLFMKLPPLISLRFFDVAARKESFVQAAEELHVTHSAISRQIRLLEEHLGCELFERRNRAVFLTTKGQLLFQTTRQIFAQLNDTVQKLSDADDAPTVSISCEPTIAMKWLIPRLTDFYVKYPEVSVHLVAAGGAIDFAKAKVDIALRRNDFKWGDDVSAVRICSERMGVVQRSDMSLHIKDNTLLSTATRPLAWQTWQKLTGQNFQDHKQIIYEHFYLCIQAALAGQGITLASFLMVEDEISSGQLLAPQGFVEDGSAYYLLSPAVIEADTHIGIFTDWLISEIHTSMEQMPFNDKF